MMRDGQRGGKANRGDQCVIARPDPVSRDGILKNEVAYEKYDFGKI